MEATMKMLYIPPTIVLTLSVLAFFGMNSLAAEEAGKMAGNQLKSVEVVISKKAGELEQFAAAELQRYLLHLFRVSVKVTP